MEYKLYTWEDFQKDLKIIEVIIKQEKFRSLAGIAFGGLPLVTALKNKFNLPTRIIFASSYNRQNKKIKLKIKLGDLDKLIEPVLIVDDIVDTGETLLTVCNYLDSKNITFKTLTLFKKNNSMIDVNFKLNLISGKTWVVFPWE